MAQKKSAIVFFWGGLLASGPKKCAGHGGGRPVTGGLGSTGHEEVVAGLRGLRPRHARRGFFRLAGSESIHQLCEMNMVLQKVTCLLASEFPSRGWGGENTDQSLRAWLCGGDILRAKSSRIALLGSDHGSRDGAPGIGVGVGVGEGLGAGLEGGGRALVGAGAENWVCDWFLFFRERR